MNKIVPLTILAALLVGCASLPEGHHTDKKAVARQSMKGGSIGCAIGALTGALVGKGSDAVKGCVAGGAAGAVSAGIKERNRQVEEANALAAHARASGLTAEVATEPVALHGESKPVTTLKGLTIDLPADVNTSAVRDVVQRAARMSDASKTPVTITVKGSKAQRATLVATLRHALKTDTTATVKEADGKASLHLAPVPDVG